MPQTSNPEEYRERWHDHVESLKGLKHTLSPEQFSELDDALNAVHDLVDDAAEELEEDNE